MNDSLDHAIVYTDGGARPTNPGHAAFGVVVIFPNSDRDDVELSRYIGFPRSNNVAEYTGLEVGLKYAYFLGARSADFHADSKLVVNQVTGEWEPKDDNMRKCCRAVRDQLDKLYPKSWTLSLVPRKENSRADLLATEAAHWGRSRNPWLPPLVKAHLAAHGRVVDPFRFKSSAAAIG